MNWYQTESKLDTRLRLNFSNSEKTAKIIQFWYKARKVRMNKNLFYCSNRRKNWEVIGHGKLKKTIKIKSRQSWYVLKVPRTYFTMSRACIKATFNELMKSYVRLKSQFFCPFEDTSNSFSTLFRKKH